MDSTQKINAAVIGCGSIGKIHAQCYAACPQTRLAAVVDIISSRAQKLASTHQAASALTDYTELLRDESIQAVSVCLPNDLHAPVTTALLRAGKHVLCEKPIALSTQEALALRDEAAKAKRKLVIGVVNRFNDNVNFIRDMIQSGELGLVYHVQTVFKNHRNIPGLGHWFTSKKRSGGGVMIDWGIHFIDLILFCLGFPSARRISGAAYGHLGRDMRKYAFTSMWAGPPDYAGTYDVEEYASGLLHTDGPTIAFEGAWAQNIGNEAMYVEFLGDKAGIRLEYRRDFTIWSVKNGALVKIEPKLPQTDMYQNEIDDFARCIRTGESSRADISTVLHSQEILDAFYESAALSREIALA